MTRALALLLIAAPAHAAGNAPGAMEALVPQEWQVSAIMGELPSCTVTGDCCGVHRACGAGPYHPALGQEPAPVPLPPTLLLLTAAIAALTWKGSNRV